MHWKEEWKKLVLLTGGFLAFFYLPLGSERFTNAIMEGLHLAKWYAQEHVLLCLVPAFFIAGAIGIFVSQGSVIKYLGAKAKKVVAYGVASVSGSVLAVCSCTVLPLFSGIYKRGAGLGPATAFLYSGPAINVMAIILTARVLGLELGIARAVGAILFSIIIGLLMHFIFRKEEAEKAAAQLQIPDEEEKRPLWQTGLFFFSLLAILIFANWSAPDAQSGLMMQIFNLKWALTGLSALGMLFMLVRFYQLAWWKAAMTATPVLALAFLIPEAPLLTFGTAILLLSLFTSTDKGEPGEWFTSSWDFAKQILPLLLMGVLIAGVLLGRAGHEGLIPPEWVASAVGGNSLLANLFASVAGAFMYFATLTEVPILQGLLGSGMGKGPALALLLAGPALSLPNMLVIRSVLGTKKTMVFISLVVVMATISGLTFGALI